jgi:hypothetical protein
MDRDTPADGWSAWNPGVGTAIPAEFRLLETILRPECVGGSAAYVDELASLTGLPHQEVTAFRASRLALHELIVRVTADIAVPEGETEEAFGHNFRRIAWRMRDAWVAPQMAQIEQAHAELQRQAEAAVRAILVQTLAAPAEAPSIPWSRRFPLRLFGTRRPPDGPRESAAEREYRIIAGYKAAGLAATDPLQRAAYKSLYRVLGAMAGQRGRVGTDLELLVPLVVRHVANTWGSQCIGRIVAPLVEAAIEREGYARVREQEAPILISLKGASAAGKSSLRPMVKRIMREQGVEPDGYATISPDVWRRMLLDYESLGPARKYAGHLTSRELTVIDGKLDRYIRDKAQRAGAIPHLLVDRFRFDSFSSDQVARVLHDTYARYVHTMYMYFVVTPPEETVERGWQRALERGRYKAVEDFLGHSVEAYAGMPRIFFKWLACQRLDYRYFFLDNRVPKGAFPKTIAAGDQGEMTIRDLAAFVDIERYQKIDIGATTPGAVYPPAPATEVARNCGFLKECFRRIARVDLVEPATGCAYARARHGAFELLDAAALARMLDDAQIAAILNEVAPRLVAAARGLH